MDITIINAIIPAISTVIVAYISIVPQIKKDNKEISKELGEVKKTINCHIEEHKYADLISCRQRLVRFVKDVKAGDKYESDAWNSIFEDVKFYKQYCKDHEGYKNGYELTVDFLDNKYNELVLAGEVKPKK